MLENPSLRETHFSANILSRFWFKSSS